MKRLKTLTLFILTFISTNISFAQTRKSEEQFKQYLQQLKVVNNDTIIILKSGCTGCNVEYSDTSESIVDGQTLYVVTEQDGYFNLAIFDDIHNPTYSTSVNCPLFKLAEQNKTILQSKEQFYKKELAELKKSKFIHPRPAHYSFEELTIHIKDYRYNFMVVDKNVDYLGFIRDNEKWFQVTKNIISEFSKYLQINQN
jgi:hypothetical protein